MSSVTENSGIQLFSNLQYCQALRPQETYSLTQETRLAPSLCTRCREQARTRSNTSWPASPGDTEDIPDVWLGRLKFYEWPFFMNFLLWRVWNTHRVDETSSGLQVPAGSVMGLPTFTATGTFLLLTFKAYTR